MIDYSSEFLKEMWQKCKPRVSTSSYHGTKEGNENPLPSLSTTISKFDLYYRLSIEKENK